MQSRFSDVPMISVVIPAYNAEGTIGATIESVQKQTYSDFELVVIDDGSTDSTLAIVHGIDDPRLKIFSCPNSGVCLARNRGTSHAKGELISFIDADDLWTCDKLQAQVDALQKGEGEIAYSWTSYLFPGRAEAVPGRRNCFLGNVYLELLKRNFVASGSNILARTEFIREVGGFDPTIPQCADWDLCLRLAARRRFALVPKYQIIYRMLSNSMTSNQIDEMERQCLLMLEKTYRSAPAEYQRLKRRSVQWVYEYCTERYLQRTTRLQPLAATKTFFMVVQSEPLTILHRQTQRLFLKLLKYWCIALKNALSFKL